MEMLPDLIPAEIKALHSLYESLTGNTLTLNWQRLDIWRTWLSYRTPAFNQSDLKAVVAYFKRTRKGGILDGSLRFHNLVARADYFEEDLSLARQAMRPRVPATKVQVSCGSARVVPNQNLEDISVPVAEVIAKMRLAVEKSRIS